MEYSFLMSIYKNTRESELQECLQSIYVQKPKPKEIVIVIDGPIDEKLEQFVYGEKKHGNIIIVKSEQNLGSGGASALGMRYCTAEWVARMDSDDICAYDRIEKQMDYLGNHPDIDVLGGYVDEFTDDIDNVISIREVPSSHDEIIKFMKMRSPINNQTVIFKKNLADLAGGYQDCLYHEDYFLWIRMFLSGAKFANIPEILTHMRIDNSTYKRRGGYKYYKIRRGIYKYMRKNGLLSRAEYIKNCFVIFVLQVLFPANIRRLAYLKFARSKK